MNHIFVDPPACRHDGDQVRVVVTTENGIHSPVTTIVGRLTPAEAAALVESVRSTLAPVGGVR